MDKDRYAEHVTGDLVTAGGVDKDTKPPIFWCKPINNGLWGYVHGSPRGKDLTRYVRENDFFRLAF